MNSSSEQVRPEPLTRVQALDAAKSGAPVVDSYGETTTVVDYLASEDTVWLALAAGQARRPRREVYPADAWTAWAAQVGWPTDQPNKS